MNIEEIIIHLGLVLLNIVKWGNKNIMLPMSLIKKFEKKGVIGLYRRFVSEGIGRFGHTVIGSLLIIMFTAGFHLQAQTINLDSLLTKEELNWLQLNKDKIRYTRILRGRLQISGRRCAQRLCFRLYLLV